MKYKNINECEYIFLCNGWIFDLFRVQGRKEKASIVQWIHLPDWTKERRVQEGKNKVLRICRREHRQNLLNEMRVQERNERTICHD